MGRKKKQPKSPRGKRYSKEFKAGAVKLVRESGMNLNQLAKQLGGVALSSFSYVCYGTKARFRRA